MEPAWNAPSPVLHSYIYTRTDTQRNTRRNHRRHCCTTSRTYKVHAVTELLCSYREIIVDDVEIYRVICIPALRGSERSTEKTKAYCVSLRARRITLMSIFRVSMNDRNDWSHIVIHTERAPFYRTALCRPFNQHNRILPEDERKENTKTSERWS